MPNPFPDERMSHYQLCERVLKHDKDLYEGNGKPSLTTRMQQAEDRLERIEASLASSAKSMRQIVYLAVGSIMAAAADIVLHSIHVGR